MSNISLFFKFSTLIAVILLTGCATTNPDYGVNDPLEGYNRAVHSFNKTFDKTIIKPIAQGYDTVLPIGVSQGVSNFFRNLADITVIFNDLLQFKFDQAWQDTGRFALNTTVGFGGILDVATLAGHKKNHEDFGQTLGVWGIQPGPYFVLPVFGASNIRDSVGLVVDISTNPINQEHVATRNALVGTAIINQRANYLGVTDLLEEAALDEYSYVRNAYMQKRLDLVYDGNPPEDNFDVFAD